LASLVAHQFFFANRVGLPRSSGIALKGNDGVIRRVEKMGPCDTFHFRNLGRSAGFGRCLNSTRRRMQMKTKTNVKAGDGIMAGWF
jgi:hypothetical protein